MADDALTEHDDAAIAAPLRREEAVVQQQASGTMLAEVTPPLATNERDTPVTNLRGAVCTTQPAQGQVPFLERGKSTNGCNFTVAPEFSTVDLYALAQQQTVHMSIMSKPPGVRRDIDTGGSGVIIGKSDSECFVATANHVVDGPPGGKVSSRAAVTADGSSFPAAVRIQDPKLDIAVVALQTGAATDAVCKPATFAQDTSYRGPAVAFGFPEGTKTLYASPGQITKVMTFAQQLRELGTRVDPREAQTDDPNRPMVIVAGQTRGGQSGGPVYNGGPEVGALVQGGMDRRSFGATVLTASMVQDFLQRVRRR